MGTAKLFKNGNSQAVRLPKECRFEGETEVVACKIGDIVVLSPKSSPWKVMWQSLDMFSDDFMADRNQPELQKRDLF